jgi:5'-deoxynucleotidase YfbR-like HD superfamily hydrolase
MKRNETSSLAEHHYLVTFVAWQLALFANSKGAKIDVLKVLEFCLIHDLGELFGGDIAMPYAKANPKAREYAKAFEAENQKFLSNFFGERQKHYQALSDEIMDAKSDEAIIAKLGDYIELTHFKHYAGYFSEGDLELVVPKLKQMVSGLKDEVAKSELSKFIDSWPGEVNNGHARDVMFGEEK